jgi:hypothetical protein
MRAYRIALPIGGSRLKQVTTGADPAGRLRRCHASGTAAVVVAQSVVR